jgi:hypothetical protein
LVIDDTGTTWKLDVRSESKNLQKKSKKHAEYDYRFWVERGNIVKICLLKSTASKLPGCSVQRLEILSPGYMDWTF